MSQSVLELDCLVQLREYVRTCGGGDLQGKWQCRAQIRDYGSRAGSVDTWFTAPDGEVFRSKVAVVRGLGLDPGVAAAKVRTQKPRAPRKPAAPRPPSAVAHEPEPWRWVPTAAVAVELSPEELAELLLSMPEALDGDEVYEGPLYYKEAELQQAARQAARAKAAAAARMAEAEAIAFAAAQAESGDESPARENAQQPCGADQLQADAEPGGEPAEGTVVAEGTAGVCSGPLPIAAAAPPQLDGGGVAEAPAAAVDSPMQDGSDDAPAAGADAGCAEEGAPENEAEGDEGREAGGVNRKGTSRRATRRQMAVAIAAAAKELQAKAKEAELAAAAAAAAAEQPTPSELAAAAAAEAELDGEEQELQAALPAHFQAREAEMEIIRKCFVRVPLRLGRPSAEEPQPLSPASRDPEATAALLDLSGQKGHGGGESSAAADCMEVDCDSTVAEGVQARPSAPHWTSRRFPVEQLTANDGAPLSLHPTALFYLRYQEEQAALEAAAAAADAAAKQQAKLEKAAAAAAGGASGSGGAGPGTGGKPSSAGAGERSKLPLPKPSNLSLRGKTVEEVEEALMERLAAYVAELGGVLPRHWRVKASVRQNGANAGGVDAYYYDPTGRRHKSMVKVAEALGLEASAAPKPKSIGSILGGGGKASGGAAPAAREDAAATAPPPPPPAVGVTAADVQDALAAAASKAPMPTPRPVRRLNLASTDDDDWEVESRSQGRKKARVVATDEDDEEWDDQGTGSLGASLGGSARKTCGTCRTCLNPQLKKGCLTNKAKSSATRKRVVPVKAPSPEAAPPRRLTARQLAKAEREAAAAALAEAKSEYDSEEEDEEEHVAQHTEEPAAAHGEQVVQPEAGAAEQSDVAPALGASAAAAQAEASVAATAVEAFVQPVGGPEQDPPLASQCVFSPQRQPAGNGTAPVNAAPDAALTAAAAAPGGAPDGNGSDDEDVDIGGVEGPRGEVHSSLAGAPTAGGTGKCKQQQGGGSSGGDAGGSGTQPARSSGGGGGKAEQKRLRNGGGGAGDDGDDDDGGGKRPRPSEHSQPEGGQRQRKNRKGKGEEAEGEEEARLKREREKEARREKRKLRDNEIVRNVYDRAYNRLRSQLSRLRQEQALVEAYAADGWRGASREKVKPVAEIKRAKEQIARCRGAIRECVRVCDEAEGDVPISADLFDSDGELDLEHIFCAKCGGNESDEENDIILCDGPCNRAYHVRCLVPPLDPSTLPEDEGWLCPGCDRKIDMIDVINDEFGTDYEYEDSWERVLAPGTLPTSPQAVAGEGPGSPRAAPVDLDRLDGLLAGADLPSEDEEDEDYEASESNSEGGAAEESGSEAEGASGGGSDGSDAKDDGSSLASEDLSGEIEDVEVDAVELGGAAGHKRKRDSSEVGGGGGAASDSEEPAVILEGKRRRAAVDYRSLNQEMFGDLGSPVIAGSGSEAEAEEEDEVWSPRVQALKKRRARRRKAADSDAEQGSGDEEESEGRGVSGEEEEHQEEEGGHGGEED